MKKLTKYQLAEWLHNNYEDIAKKTNWDTQKSCKVEFDNLPVSNKLTMLELADRILKEICKQ